MKHLKTIINNEYISKIKTALWVTVMLFGNCFSFLGHLG